MAKRPTAGDVAKRADVSRAAVSLVLGGRSEAARISEDTRARVLKAAKDLMYVPDSAGRSLVSGRTRTIGLIVRDLSLLSVNPYLLALFNGILERGRSEGYRVLFESARTDKNGDPFGELLNSGRVDGMIVENPDYGDKSLGRAIESGRPVVVIGTRGRKGEASVAIDNRRIAFLATHHLISIGRRNVAHIAYSARGIYGVDERLAGYQAALRTARLPFRPGLVEHADFSMESGYRAMSSLLARVKQVDAVFAGSDALALGAMAAASDAGLRIPRDVAFAGVDDIDAARFCRPSLTTVPSHPFKVGTFAAATLIDLMSGRKPEVRNRVIPSELVVRGSSDEAYVDDFARP